MPPGSCFAWNWVRAGRKTNHQPGPTLASRNTIENMESKKAGRRECKMPFCKWVPRKRGDNNRLLAYANSVTSQCGEDGILEYIFQTIPESNKHCVEFGAWDGRYLSNVWNLTRNRGWKALFIEANPQRFQQLRASHQDNPNAICLNRYVQFAGPDSMDRILHEVGFPTDLDLISVDIDGNDWYIWDSLAVYQPKVVLIEFNPTIPNDVIYVQDPDPSINQGCSLLALIELGKRKGYELIATTEWNAFFVRKEWFPLFKIEDNAIDAMYDDAQYGSRFFQLFDGTLVLAGVKHLIWHDIPIPDEAIQVLPPHARRFPDQ
jgi:hypothetical protein